MGLLIKLIFSGLLLRWTPKQDLVFDFFFFWVLVNLHIPNTSLVLEPSNTISSFLF